MLTSLFLSNFSILCKIFISILETETVEKNTRSIGLEARNITSSDSEVLQDTAYFFMLTLLFIYLYINAIYVFAEIYSETCPHCTKMCRSRW